MQIHYITPAILSRNTAYLKQNKKDLTLQPAAVNTSRPDLAKLPSTRDYLSFTGGYSLNLADTITNLDKLAQKNSAVYPKHIREWAGMILESGNKAKQTLIDIHKKYYESLKSCTTLDEVKQKFSEFADVLSDSEVSFSKNSFGEAVKAGEMECFDKNEDLSLQILKLYYGEGFSLNDLKQYTDGKDIHWTMKKLNIPRQNQTYGQILKLSDPDYNARLTAEMTYKRRLALDKKAQEAGEPVYIPRGPLSKEHREHISEGLKKYYQENPARIYEMSAKMKEFYRQNPEKSEEMTRVLQKAWNAYGADRIKSALSGFMKNKGFKNFNPEANPVEISKEQSNALKQFWGMNEWARKTFSRNMEYAWKKVKEENEAFFSIRTVPVKLRKFVEEKAGLTSGTLNVDTTYNPYLKTSSIDEISNAIFTKYTDIKGLQNVMADTYQISILHVLNSLKDMNLRRKPKDFQVVLDYAAGIVRGNLQKDGSKPYKIQSTDEAQSDYMELAMIAAQSKNQELVDIINNALEEGFEMAMDFHKDFILK